MEGWKTVTLGEVLKVLRNGVSCKQNKNGIGQKISRIESIATGKFDLGRVGYAELSLEVQEKFRLSTGDILFSHINSPPHVGKTAMFCGGNEVFHGMNLLLIRASTQILSEYLDLYLKFLFNQGYWRTRCKQAVNQASVNQEDIKRVSISYPSLPEQERIISILDESFAAIDTAIANTEKNLANAQKLFESQLNNVFLSTERAVVEGWKTKQLGKVAVSVDYGHTASAKYDGDGPKFLRITDIQDGFVDWSSVPLCECDADELEKYRLQYGDIVFARTGATTGKSYLVKELLTDTVFASYLICVRLNDSVLPYYMGYFFQSPNYWNQISESSTGSAQPGVNATKLKKLIVPIPLLPEQQRIASVLDETSSLTMNLKSNYTGKLEALTELKQSILHQAFTGQLTNTPTESLKAAGL